MKDQADKVYNRTYDEIVGEWSLDEHTKDVSEKIKDIFEHTDRKFHKVMLYITSIPLTVRLLINLTLKLMQNSKNTWEQ